MRNAMWAFLLILVFSLTISLAARPTHQPRYTVVVLPAPPGQAVSVDAINDRGEILGTAHTATGQMHAVIWQNSKMIDIGTLPGYTESFPGGINSKGQVIGNATTPGYESKSQAFLWQNGKMQSLPSLGGTSTLPLGINDKGQIVGSADTKTFDSHAVMWEHGRLIDLGLASKGALYSANAINDHGLIAGEVTRFRDYHSYTDLAIVFNGRLHDLGVIQGRRTMVNAINNRNEIVGWAEVPLHAEQIRGFTAVVVGTKVQLRMLAPGSVILDINDKGQIVGQMKDHAFIESNDKTDDLNALIPNGSGWTLWRADGINNRGQIVGMGSYNGHEAAYLLTPR